MVPAIKIINGTFIGKYLITTAFHANDANEQSIFSGLNGGSIY